MAIAYRKIGLGLWQKQRQIRNLMQPAAIKAGYTHDSAQAYDNEQFLGTAAKSEARGPVCNYQIAV